MLLNRIFFFKSRLPRLLNSFSSAKQESIIGIDLGTTNSCVAIMQGTTPKVIQNSEGARTTPSIVAFTRQGARLVGNPAKRQAITNSQNTIFAAKRLIGRQFDEVAVQKDIKHLPYKVVKASNGDAWIQANGQSFSPSQIGAFVLTKMKQTADEYLGKSCQNAVVTVPAYFNDSQRQATKDAGRIAGLNIKRIINEPTAAALAYGIDKEDNKTIAVYDLGGGTFDVSILEIKDGVFEVKATNGDTSCGGEDADAIIQQFLIAEFKRQHKIDIVKDKTALQRFRQAAQKAKIQLSQLASTEINLPFITNTSSGSVHFTYNLTRAKLQSLMDEFLKKTIKPCENCIKDAGITKNKIEEVILVGGMSRMPKVQKLVQDIFGKVASKSVNPDEVVAVGAAIQGGVLKGDVKDLILLDVTPLTLGIEVLGGVFLKIIPRNSSIPIKRTKEVVTVHDGQTEMSIKIYQGERDVARDNKYLGQFLFRGIIAAPKGVPKIQVIFSIDANGILLVEAIDKITRKRYSTTIQSSGGLSSFEIQQMLKKAEKYKEDDKKRRQFIDLKNQSESLVGNIQDQINEHRGKLSQELLSEVESSLENLKSVLESSTLGYKQSDQLVKARENAHKIHLKIGEFIYNKNAQQQSSNDKK